jgi:hypothetical protein
LLGASFAVYNGNNGARARALSLRICCVTAFNFGRVLEALRQRKPFQMFTVELNGGQRFEVDHPGALVVRDGVAVFLAPRGVPIWFDHDSVKQILGALADTQLDERGEQGSK